MKLMGLFNHPLSLMVKRGDTENESLRSLKRFKKVITKRKYELEETEDKKMVLKHKDQDLSDNGGIAVVTQKRNSFEARMNQNRFIPGSVQHEILAQLQDTLHDDIIKMNAFDKVRVSIQF